MMSLPESIDLRITSRCNLRCPFCFGPRNIDEIDLNDWLKLIDLFADHGVRHLVMTGGEPTLFPEYTALLRHAGKKGMRTVLSTNGMMLDERTLDTVLDSVFWVSLPLDGDDFRTCQAMRGMNEEGYSVVFSLLEYIKKNRPEVGLKVGTVVTRTNIRRIPGIFPQIQAYADVWKLYQICPHENNAGVFQALRVSETQFAELYGGIMQKYGKNHRPRIVPQKADGTDGMYLFCEPDGAAMTIRNGREYRFGSFVTGFGAVMENWRRFIDSKKLTDNFRSTYLCAEG
jgi:MoaA/NifB/PqqE/SkfB family radical SAM enzyme